MSGLAAILLVLLAGATTASGPGGPMVTYEIKGGKWPGIYERLDVAADGALRYEVLSAERIAGAGRLVGRFSAPADAARAKAIREAVAGVRIPAAALPPGAVVASLKLDGAAVAEWRTSDAPHAAAVLHSAVAAAMKHPKRTLTLDLGADGRSLVLTATGDSAVTIDATGDEFRLDLRFKGGDRKVLDATQSRAALGIEPGVLSIATGHPRTLPLAPSAPAGRLDAAMLVAPSDVATQWTVSVSTK